MRTFSLFLIYLFFFYLLQERINKFEILNTNVEAIESESWIEVAAADESTNKQTREITIDRNRIYRTDCSVSR